jgi:polyphosphate kinase 2 (PPK2 family)
MKIADFVVAKRPKLSAIERFPHMDFSEHEHGLATVQEMLQRIQQAYLGAHERAVIVLESWDTAGKGGVVRRSIRAA